MSQTAKSNDMKNIKGSFMANNQSFWTSNISTNDT